MRPILYFSLCFALILSSANVVQAKEFFLSTKGYSAVIVKISSQNTEDASMVGVVEKSGAKEYCVRDPGGITKQYGGKLTVSQCVDQVMRRESGKLYSANANCVKKTITSDVGTNKLVKYDEDGNPIWYDLVDGVVLDGSSASGAPVLTEQFRTMCPRFMKNRP
jgi:hypothetical protein